MRYVTFFFFYSKHKTAYELRISDWSSDVCSSDLFRHWARCRDGTLSRAATLALLRPIRQEIDRLLLRGAFSGQVKLVGMCKPLYAHRDWLWTFLDRKSVV